MADDYCCWNWEFKDLAPLFSEAWVTPALERGAPPFPGLCFQFCTLINSNFRNAMIFIYCSPIFGDIIYLYGGFLYLCFDVVYIPLIV